MNKQREEALELLTTRHVLFSCEGRAEQVIITKLIESGCIVVPDDRIVRDMDGHLCTRLRKAKDIQKEFLWTDYPDGLLIARVVDVNPGKLVFNKPYRLRDIRVLDFITRPEIERLILVKEGQLGAFEARRGRERQLNASDWCEQKLGLPNVKSKEFLEAYWHDAHELMDCIRKAQSSLGGKRSGELGLVDLLK